MSEHRLTAQELYVAAMVGIRRRIISLYNGAQDRVPAAVDGRGGWNIDIEAAAAELVYAKAAGAYWDFSVGTYSQPDVGNVQVKHTDGKDGRSCLLLRPSHDENQLYALVVGMEGTYEVYAPVFGTAVKEFGDYRDPGDRGKPCWMLPKTQLRLIPSQP